MFGGTSFSGSQSIFGQTSNTTKSSTNPFGSTSQTIFGVQKTSPTGIAPFGVASTPKTHSGFSAFATTTTQLPSQPAAGSNIFGVQRTTPSVGNTAASGSGGQSMGSRAVPYRATKNTRDDQEKNTLLHTITAIKAYEQKSIEELRFEDYQLGDKGGKKKNPPFASNRSSTPPPSTTSSLTFPKPSSNPFDNSTKTNIFGPKSTPSPSRLWPSSSIFNTQTIFPSPSPSTQTSLFSPNPTIPSPFTTTTPSTQPSPFPPNPSTPFAFTTPPFTQRSPFSPNPTFPSPFPIFTTTTTPTPTPLFPFSPNPTTPSPFTTTPPSTQPSPFSPNPTTPSPFTTTSPSTPLFPLPQTPSTPPLHPSQPLQTNTTPTTNGFNPTQSQQQHQQQQQQQQPVVILVPATNPFGIPRAPQMSYGDVHQYGISSMPVVDRPAPAPVKFSSKLTARHLIRPLSASARKYNAYKNETSNTHPKVPFFQ